MKSYYRGKLDYCQRIRSVNRGDGQWMTEIIDALKKLTAKWGESKRKPQTST